jgi:hypothetical protein
MIHAITTTNFSKTGLCLTGKSKQKVAIGGDSKSHDSGPISLTLHA